MFVIDLSKIARIVRTLLHFSLDACRPMPKNAFISLLIASLLLLSQVSAYAGHQCAAASGLQHAAMTMPPQTMPPQAMPAQAMMADMHHHMPANTDHHRQASAEALSEALSETLSDSDTGTKTQHCHDCNCASPCAAGASVGMDSDWSLAELPIAMTDQISNITNNLLDNDPAPPFRPPSHA